MRDTKQKDYLGNAVSSHLWLLVLLAAEQAQFPNALRSFFRPIKNNDRQLDFHAVCTDDAIRQVDSSPSSRSRSRSSLFNDIPPPRVWLNSRCCALQLTPPRSNGTAHRSKSNSALRSLLFFRRASRSCPRRVAISFNRQPHLLTRERKKKKACAAYPIFTTF